MEQPNHCSRLVCFDAKMVPFCHAREGCSRKNVNFRRSERFSFPHSLSLVTCDLFYPLTCPEPDSWPLYQVRAYLHVIVTAWRGCSIVLDSIGTALRGRFCASLPQWTIFFFFSFCNRGRPSSYEIPVCQCITHTDNVVARLEHEADKFNLSFLSMARSTFASMSFTGFTLPI